MTDTLTLRVPTDPALAVTVRVFIAESARVLGLDQPSVEDLRLLATELLASGVESRTDAVQINLARANGEGWRLTARGTGPLDASEPAELPIRRIDLLRGIASVEQVGDAVVCSELPQTNGADGA